MSNAYSLLSTGNTFGDWVVTTNALTKENNDFHANSYHKNAGTLYLDDSSLGLQVNNSAIFAGAFQVTGTGSSATIQKNLTVQSGQVYFQNTEISLIASGNVTAPNVISTNVTVSGNILSSNVYVTKNLTTSNIVATGSVFVTNNVTTSNVVASNVYVISNVTTSNIVATGSVFVTNNVTTSNVVATGVYVSSNVFVTNNVTTSNVVATGSVYVTTNINAANIVSTNVTASGNIFSSNSFITSNLTTSNVVATGSVYVTSNVTTSNVVASNVYVISNVTTSNIVATGSVFVTTNINAANIVSTNVTASGNIFSSNSFVTSNISTSNIVATGSVFVTTNINAANIVSTNVTASGNIFSSNSFVTSNVTTSNVVATGSVFVTNNVTASNVVASNVYVASNITTSNIVATSSVYVTSNVTTSNVVATGSVFVTSNVRAANIVSTNVTASGNIFSSNVFVTSNITTSNIVATGVVTVGGNMGVGTTSPVSQLHCSGTFTITGAGQQIDNSQGISSKNTSGTYRQLMVMDGSNNLGLGGTVDGGIIFYTNGGNERMRLDSTGNVTINNNLAVTNNVSSANVVTSKLYVSGTTQLVGTANTTADLGIGGNLNVPNVLFMGGSSSSANIYSLTVGQSAGNGGLTVQGNFTIAQPTIYQAPSFTLYGGTPITGGNFAYFNVNRSPSTNASIRWNETNKEFAVANVDSSVFYRIVTDEYSSGSSSSANSMTYPTSYALANANTFLQSYTTTSISTANTGLKSYGDATYFAKTGGTISGTVTISSGGLVSTVSPIGITSGGTNNNTYTTGQVLQYNGSSFASLANVTAFSATGSSTAIPIITTDAYGRVTSLSTASISTTLSLAAGVSAANGSGSVALSTQTLNITSTTPNITSVTAENQKFTIASQTSGVAASTYGTSTAIPVLTIDTYGRVTSASTTGISTTITLSVGSGATGSVSGGGTLTIGGGTAISTSISSGTFTINNTGVTSFGTTLTGLTVNASTGAVVLGGTLGVASGGTGVTTSTGTGSVVLNTSPTFITPALGTPASGNFSTGTFTWPTFNQNTTGTAGGLSGTPNISVGTVTTSGLITVNQSVRGYGGVVVSANMDDSIGSKFENLNNGSAATSSIGVSCGSSSAAGLGFVAQKFLQRTAIEVSDSDFYIRGAQTNRDIYINTNYSTNAIKIQGSDNSVTFYGPVNGITKTMVGLGNVDNTADANKSVSFASTAGSAAGLSATLAVASGGTGVTSSTGTGSVVLSASPTFTGTVSGITKSMVGLSNVDNTADASKSVSYASTAGSATTAGNITAYTINQNLGTGNDVTHAVITGSAFYYSSDARLKTNITELTNHWDILNNLRPVNFDWISTGKKAQGLLAQEVQKVLPEAINTTIDGTLSIDSSGIVAHLIAAIQDLKSQVDELNKKLEK